MSFLLMETMDRYESKTWSIIEIKDGPLLKGLLLT